MVRFYLPDEGATEFGWGRRMPSYTPPQALRVPGVPTSVAMWIDHERDDDVLYLNADLFTADQERQLSRALRRGDFTARELLNALVPVQGD